MNVLILGGNGLLGQAIASKMLKDHNIIVIDTTDNARLVNQYHRLNIFEHEALRKIAVSSKTEIIINAVNIATIMSANGKVDTKEIINFVFGLKTILGQTGAQYIQLGTTGSGGLGLDIPFTHGDDLNNMPILNKSAAAGVLTMMLVLLSRTINNRIVEIKPGLSIFNTEIKHDGHNGMNIVTIDGGESGHYTFNELALLTRYMGFTSVDNIAELIIRSIGEKNVSLSMPKLDVVSAINSQIINQTDDDICLRNTILNKMDRLSGKHYLIATGNLGPANTTKLLYDGYLTSQEIGPLKNTTYLEISKQMPVIAKNMAYLKVNNPKAYEYLCEQRPNNVYPHKLYKPFEYACQVIDSHK